MFANNNTMGFGGYGQGGAYQQPGMQYNPRPQAKMTQTLTAEQIKKLKGSSGTFDLHISQTDMWRAICTHKENGNIVLVEDATDGTVTCPICGEKFVLSYLEDKDVKQATDLTIDILQSIKTMYLDIPEEMANQYFQMIPLIKKLPELYKLARNNFNIYDQSNPVMQTGSMFGFNALNAFTSPAYGMQQPMMGVNPAMMYAPQPQAGMPYANPMMGGNPFGYNDGAAYQAQPVQQPAAQPVAQPAAAPAPQQSAQDAAQVTNQKVFNV